MVKGCKIRERVWSRAGGSECRCGPGLKKWSEHVVQCKMIGVRVWSRAGGSE